MTAAGPAQPAQRAAPRLPCSPDSSPELPSFFPRVLGDLGSLSSRLVSGFRTSFSAS